MRNEFTPADIIWVKNVTDHAIGKAYFPFTGLLHFPDNVGVNINAPQVDEIILLRQTLHGRMAFTHLVSPIDEVIVPQPGHPGYGQARNVKLIAMTSLNNPILPHDTTFPHLWTFGNACTIEAKHNPPPGYHQLQANIWKAFEPYLLSPHVRKTR